MKINYSHSALGALTETIARLFPNSAEKKRLQSGTRLKAHNHFHSWPRMPKRMLCSRSGLELSPKVDIQAVEKFLRNHKERGKMSTVLSPSLDDWYGWNVTQTLAIKKMANLVIETVADMKMVELLHSSRKKG